MYTLYTSVSKFLPPTSYMKAIEWWLLFHILVPLIIFVVLFLQASHIGVVAYFCFSPMCVLKCLFNLYSALPAGKPNEVLSPFYLGSLCRSTRQSTWSAKVFAGSS